MPTTRPLGDVSHPRPPENRRHVMFAMALEPDAAQHDHLVIAFDFVERFLQDRGRILGVAHESFLQRAGDAGGSLDQAATLRVIACPPKDGSHRSFDLGAIGPGGMDVQAPHRLKRAHIGTHRNVLLSPARERRRLLWT